jgi:hypothetical protein
VHLKLIFVCLGTLMVSCLGHAEVPECFRVSFKTLISNYGSSVHVKPIPEKRMLLYRVELGKFKLGRFPESVVNRYGTLALRDRSPDSFDFEDDEWVIALNPEGVWFEPIFHRREGRGFDPIEHDFILHPNLPQKDWSWKLLSSVRERLLLPVFSNEHQGLPPALLQVFSHMEESNFRLRVQLEDQQRQLIEKDQRIEELQRALQLATRQDEAMPLTDSGTNHFPMTVDSGTGEYPDLDLDELLEEGQFSDDSVLTFLTNSLE